jgi:hypothetical protein
MEQNNAPPEKCENCGAPATVDVSDFSRTEGYHTKWLCSDCFEAGESDAELETDEEAARNFAFYREDRSVLDRHYDQISHFEED